MKLKEFLKANSSVFGYGDLVIYERGYYMMPDDLLGYVDCDEVYRGLIFEATKCSTQLKFVNSRALFKKGEHKKIKKYLNREIASTRMYTGINKKYRLKENNFDKRIVEIVIYNELSVL